MAPKKASSKEDQMLKKFNEMDVNGDGCLEFKELEALLKKGNPDFTTKEVRQLYDNCDLNHDGKIEFKEFLAYIMKTERNDHAKSRTSEGRRSELAKETGPHPDDTEKDWSGVKEVFKAFAGDDMDGREFAKFCKDNHLIGHGFTKADVDMTFAKIVPKGKRRMDFAMFQDAVRLIAHKRGQTNGEIQDIVAKSDGPHLAGTKLDDVRFYDDKSTFTGAAAFNDKFVGVDPHSSDRTSEGRHSKAAVRSGPEKDDTEKDWSAVKEVFTAFAGPDMDGREFAKFCKDNHLIGHGFTNSDVDLTFAKVVPKGKRRMDFFMFQDACRLIAMKRGQTNAEIQDVVAKSDGPHLAGTKTDDVRFHDDKSLYTGAHGAIHGRDGHGDGRHDSLAREAAKLSSGDEGEHDWAGCDEVYHVFAAEKGQLQSRDFMKMMVDVKIFDTKFTKNDVDTTFTHVVGRSVKVMSREQFHTAIREVAQKKRVPVYQVQSAIENCEGPHNTGTKGEYSKFHDDHSTYTGMHHGK